VKQPFPAGLIAASVAFVVASSSAKLLAQMQPSQPAVPHRLEAASLALPDAPTPQTGVPASAPATPPPAPPAAPQPGPPAPSAVPAPSSAPSQVAPADPPDDKQQQRSEAERELKAEEKQRLLGVMPQFQVVMGGKAVPLTGGEKWRLALHSAIDPFYIGWAFVIGGGYGELIGSNDGYGWGADGYIKRVGANYADNVNGALIGNALLPQLLHQDPRYFRMGAGPIKKRFVYAALSTVICHGDNGKNQPNVSNVLGNFISGGISNLYYPENERGVALTFENGASVTLFGALGGQLLEFGPDLARLVTRHRHKAPPAPPAAAPASPPPPAALAPTPTPAAPPTPPTPR